MASGLDLGKQIGPLPLGAWIAVTAGALGIAYFMNKNQANAANQPVQIAESGVGVGGGQFVYDPAQSVSGPEQDKTNVAWGINATNWLVAQNHDAVESDNAVRKYLAGMPLSVKEKALLALAITHFGVAPEPIQPVDQPTTPTTPPSGAAPPAVTALAYHRYTIRNDITWKHSGVNVTHFHVQAINRKNGSTYTWVIPARGDANTNYVQIHMGSPAWTWKSRPPFDYIVRPFNGTTAGPISKIAAAQFLPAK